MARGEQKMNLDSDYELKCKSCDHEIIYKFSSHHLHETVDHLQTFLRGCGYSLYKKELDVVDVEND